MQKSVKLCQVDLNKNFELYTDASNFAIAGILYKKASLQISFQKN